MCEICHHTPCLNGCPNKPEPKPVLHCAYCGEGIYVGDKYYQPEEDPICADCMEEHFMFYAEEEDPYAE